MVRCGAWFPFRFAARGIETTRNALFAMHAKAASA
jgi:hypothetical protein